MSKTNEMISRLTALKALANLDSAHIQTLASMATPVSAKKGELLFKHGADAEHFYLVESGLVLLQVFVAGKGGAPLQTVGPGEAIGWSWFGQDRHWEYDGVIQQDAELLEFSGKQLRAAMDADCDFGYAFSQVIIQMLIGRVHASRLQVLDIYGAPE